MWWVYCAKNLAMIQNKAELKAFFSTSDIPSYLKANIDQVQAWFLFVCMMCYCMCSYCAGV